MECALENITIDHEWAIEKLNSVVDKLKAEGKINV